MFPFRSQTYKSTPTVSGLGSSGPRRKPHTLLRDVLEIALVALVLYIGISFAVQTVRVEGSSMLPTLQNDDLLLASKISYHFHDPQRGDVVILKPPNETRDFIKRVIGLPGDQIEIDGNYTDTSHNGHPNTTILIRPAGSSSVEKFVEPYLDSSQSWTVANMCCQSGASGLQSNDSQPHFITIPNKQYFVLGDNRNASQDSRYLGFIPRENILAKAWLRLWPFGNVGGLGPGSTLVPSGIVALPGLLWRRRKRSGLTQ